MQVLKDFRADSQFVHHPRKHSRHWVIYSGNKGRIRPQSLPSDAIKPEELSIPTKLNNIPHSREIRNFFYDDVVRSVDRALIDGCDRISVVCRIPETNDAFDVYRVGTLLEMVRAMVTSITKKDSSNVKVCVQQSLGQGVFQGTPLSLSGVRRILERQMDWGEAESFVRLGQLGADVVDEECNTYILIAPQNITGHSVVPLIKDMVEKAQAMGNKRIIMVNPKLGDLPSSGGVMGIRGRDERMAFVDSFITAHHFRLLYIGIGPYPIMGALRHSHVDQTWDVYKRVELVDDEGQRGEAYIFLESFENEPNPSEITSCFQRK